ncbi:hypothetical protein MKX01_036872 [Papaver californicum]|nr:hypothetical protein MKX01_036872 [Papaver californicum]
MASSSDEEIVSDLLPLLQVYKNGRVERFLESERVPPSLQDQKTGVSSKDIKFSTNPDIYARLYIPSKFISTTEKLPLLLFFHGGAFCIESAFSLHHQRYLNALVSQANVVAVSVEYRLAPEYPLPIAYEDCWTSLQWALAHQSNKNDGHRSTFPHGFNEEPWLKDNVDFNRVFFGGDSAGANISHNLAMRRAAENVIRGICLIHPYFWGSKPINEFEINMDLVNKMWLFVCPSAKNGSDDPMINPFADDAPSMSGLGCKRVLVCVAGKDPLKDRGLLYYEGLKKSGWEGEVELFENKEDGHEFHLHNPDSESAQQLFKCIASFLNK